MDCIRFAHGGAKAVNGSPKQCFETPQVLGGLRGHHPAKEHPLKKVLTLVVNVSLVGFMLMPYIAKAGYLWSD